MNLVKERTEARKWGTRIGIPVAVILLLVVGGPFVYINFISKDAPERLTLPPAAQSSDSTVAGIATSTPALPAAGLDGRWTVAGGSQAGYRVKEVIFGQDNEAAGRTNKVTGEFTLAGSTVQAATVTVDMTSISSDEDRRDSQFRGRIMSTGTFPTATFTLSQPITVPSIPAENVDSKVQANGQLNMRGLTKPVVADIQARRTGGKIQVAGSIPIKFDDWNIPNPSSPGITTQDNGLVEFLLTFTKA